MGHRRAQMLRKETRLAPAPEGATRGLTVDVLAACIFVFSRKVVAATSRWSRVRQAEGRRRKSDLRTQPVIDAEARQAKLGYLSDVREPSRAWSRTRAPRAVGRRGSVS